MDRLANEGMFFELTIAEMLKTEGYATAEVGKWHLGHLPQFLPTNQGTLPLIEGIKTIDTNINMSRLSLPSTKKRQFHPEK